MDPIYDWSNLVGAIGSRLGAGLAGLGGMASGGLGNSLTAGSLTAADIYDQYRRIVTTSTTSNPFAPNVNATVEVVTAPPVEDERAWLRRRVQEVCWRP